MPKASQLNLRPHRRFDETLLVAEQPQQQEPDATQREPEEEPQEQEQADVPIDGEEEQRQDEEQPPMQDGDEEDEPELPLPVQAETHDADVPDVPPPPPMPSMEEYQRRWREKKAFHSRENNRSHSLRNLVPKPLPQ